MAVASAAVTMAEIADAVTRVSACVEGHEHAFSGTKRSLWPTVRSLT